MAKDPAERPQSAAEFVAELEAVAVAAYGEDWEDRGRGELAALVGLLAAPSGEAAAEAAVRRQTPAVVPVAAASAAAAGPGAGAPPLPPTYAPAGGPQAPAPRFSRRAKILAVTAAAVIIAGAVTVTAVATGSKDGDTTAANPTPTAVTSLTPAPAEPSPTVSLSASPTVTVSPSGTPPQALTTTKGVSSTPTGTPATSPTIAPTTPSADPTKTGKPAAGPHVSSIAVTGFDCSAGSRRTATATVYVTYDGTADGTLHLTWWRSATGKPHGAVTLARQTAHFPKGAQNYTFTDRYTFTPDRDHPYVGLSVSSDPAADSGNGTYGVGCR